MSLISEAFLFERYGPRLNADQLSEFLGVAKQTLYNMVTTGRCPIATYVDGKNRYADYRDVAKHLDECRERAR